jgi:hypothetical protein
MRSLCWDRTDALSSQTAPDLLAAFTARISDLEDMFAKLQPVEGNTPTSLIGRSEGSPISQALSAQPPAGDPELFLARKEADSSQGAGEAAEHGALEPAPADGTADPVYACDFMCGFRGTFADVQAHEISCALNIGSESAVMSPDVGRGDGEQSAHVLPGFELLSAENGPMNETQQSTVRTSKPPATPASPGPVLKAHRSPLNRRSNYFKKRPSPASSPAPVEAAVDPMEVTDALAMI